MPFYRVYVGYGIADTAVVRIQSSGIPPEIYSGPVRVVNAYTSLHSTVFEIEAPDEVTANEWNQALKFAVGIVTEYTPVPPENPDLPPTPLNVWAKVGTWTKSVGAAATTISGLTSAPKGLILWGSGLSGATMATWYEAAAGTIGFSDGTTNRCYGCTEQDNVSTTNTNRFINNKAFQLVDPSLEGTNVALESCTATFGSTSFDLAWNATTLATTGFYFVFGGSDITNVAVKDYTAGTTVNDTVVTYTGMGFQPNFAMFMAPFMNIAAWSGLTAAAGLMHCISVHAGADPSKTWTTAVKSTDSVTSSNTGRLQRVGKLFATMATTSNTQQQVAEFDSWTADGFKLKWTTAPNVTNRSMSGLFVKGGRWDAGSFVEPIATGVSTVTCTLAETFSKPQGVVGISISRDDMSSSTTGVAVAKYEMGAQDRAGGKGCLAFANNTAIMPVRTATRMVSDKFHIHIGAAAEPASSTLIESSNTISDMTTDGEFTVNFGTTGTLARQTVWFSLSA